MTARPPVRRSRSFGAGVVAVLVGAVVWLAGPAAGPAHACSCFASSEEALFDTADAVFRGELVGYQAPPVQPVMSSTDPATWTFAVTEVYKGEVAPTQPVLSSVSGASCGLELPHAGEFYVFVSRRDLMGQPTPDQYQANLCGGTRSTSAGPLAVAALQPPTTVTTPPPPPTTEAPPETTATTVAPVVTEPAPTTTVTTNPLSLERQTVTGGTEVALDAADDDEAGGLPVGLVGAAAVALVGVGGSFAYRRHHRPPAGGW